MKAPHENVGSLWDEIRAGEADDPSANAGLSFAQSRRDDLAARRCAATLQIPVLGSIGIVLRAKRAGLLASAAPLMTQLKTSGMYASDEFIRALLSAIGE